MHTYNVQKWVIKLTLWCSLIWSGKTALAVTDVILFCVWQRKNYWNLFFIEAFWEHFDRKIADLDLYVDGSCRKCWFITNGFVSMSHLKVGMQVLSKRCFFWQKLLLRGLYCFMSHMKGTGVGGRIGEGSLRFQQA